MQDVAHSAPVDVSVRARVEAPGEAAIAVVKEHDLALRLLHLDAAEHRPDGGVHARSVSAAREDTNTRILHNDLIWGNLGPERP